MRIADSYEEYLYPYAFKKLLIIVPKYLTPKSFFWQSLVSSPLLSVWILVIILFTVLQIVFRRVVPTAINYLISDKFIETVGIILGTSTPNYQKKNLIKSELILIIFGSIFALLAGIYFSGMIFEQLITTVMLPNISTIEDINKLKWIIHYPSSLDPDLIQYYYKKYEDT